jgi:N-acetylglutamate synthase-like GNAT family acetyltransferase
MTSRADVTVRLGAAADLPAVVELYREWRYRGGVQPDDRLVVAEHDGRIVGVVRLTREHGHTMLRGMRVQPPYQRSGVGTRMLRLFEQQLEDECLCVPFAHLLGFYGQIGFQEISRDEAPRFLAERARSYEAEGHRVAIMRRPG